jgi:hypothetical protein
MEVVKLKGQFIKSGSGYASSWKTQDCATHLSLTLKHDDDDAVFRVKGSDDELWEPGYHCTLGHGGKLPSGACVRGNDEIEPEGSYYEVEAEACDSRHNYTYHYFNERVEITGDEAVDLTPPVEPEPEAFDPYAHLSPRERDLMAVDGAIVRDGTMKFGKKNRVGFFAGSIHCPTSSAGAVSLPSGENGIFGVFPFSLPFAAVVNRVSILVDTADKGTATIGIYDASGSKRCDVSIDVSRSGLATGIFPNGVNLNEGDHFLAWRTDKVCNAQLRGIGDIDQLNLLNASGVALMGTGRSQPGGTLPDMLGVIAPNASRNLAGPTYAPILAFFKA